uniref:MULE domain-containing protein n=1 Tax=Parastrongyloides trichosuri TaxID=131310 RepID=A0A0N4ZXF4_PARTI
MLSLPANIFIVEHNSIDHNDICRHRKNAIVDDNVRQEIIDLYNAGNTSRQIEGTTEHLNEVVNEILKKDSRIRVAVKNIDSSKDIGTYVIYFTTDNLIKYGQKHCNNKNILLGWDSTFKLTKIKSIVHTFDFINRCNYYIPILYGISSTENAMAIELGLKYLRDQLIIPLAVMSNCSKTFVWVFNNVYGDLNIIKKHCYYHVKTNIDKRYKNKKYNKIVETLAHYINSD